jgi:HEAT repeat protein
MGSGEAHWRRVEELEKSRDARELIEVLEDDQKECWHTKTAAIRSLAEIGEGGAAILKTLARDRDPEVRQCAIEVLAQLKYAQAKKMLSRIATDETDPLRENAQRALEEIDDD